ncbi:MAG: YbjN domain-containing protein [Defluviitaleaceae bacterium]|nr:YbjN domain-containing protein [Defluviitaleaceae bacterium]
MAKAHDIAEAVRVFLGSFDEEYQYDATTEQFELDIELKNRLVATRMIMLAQDDGLTLYTVVNVLAEPHGRADVAEYLIRANHGLLCGGFEMDMDTGTINYKTFIHCGGAPPADLDMKVGMAMSIAALNRFGNGLIDVINNEMTPEEAANEAKGLNRRD